MLDKKKYLEWMNEGVTKLFEDYSIREMDQVSRHLLAIIDWNEASQKRRENYEILHNLIHKNGKFEIVSELEEGEVPFCMPVCTQNRDDLLRYLIRNKIYCNVHWRLSEAVSYTHLRYKRRYSPNGKKIPDTEDYLCNSDCLCFREEEDLGDL